MSDIEARFLMGPLDGQTRPVPPLVEKLEFVFHSKAAHELIVMGPYMAIAWEAWVYERVADSGDFIYTGRQPRCKYIEQSAGPSR